MRVLLVVDDLEIGGAQRQVVGLAKALAERGNVVVLACSARGRSTTAVESVSSLAAANVRVVVLGHRRVAKRVSPGFALRIARLVRRERFDVVHAHVHAASMAAALAGLATRVPVVVTEHSMASWRGRLAQRYSRPLYRRCAVVLAVSEEIRRRLTGLDRVPPDRVRVVGTALFPEECPGTDAGHVTGALAADFVVAGPGDTVRTAHPPDGAAPPGGVHVGVVARLQPEKGLDVFLRAVAEVAPEFPQARFSVVGDGDLKPALTALAERLGVSGRVRFAGACGHGAAAVGGFDLLCLPSRTEGAPLVVLEALAAGVPIVASAVGAVPEQLDDGNAGVLVRPGDPQALAAALRHLLGSPAELALLATAAAKRSAALPTWGDLTDAVEATYRRVLRDG